MNSDSRAAKHNSEMRQIFVTYYALVRRQNQRSNTEYSSYLCCITAVTLRVIRQSAADPDQVRYTWTCQGVTTFREFLAQSAHFGQLRNGRFSPNLVTKRSSVSRRGIRKNILENFHFRGHLLPKSEIENRSNRHLSQSRLQVTGCTAER